MTGPSYKAYGNEGEYDESWHGGNNSVGWGLTATQTVLGELLDGVLGLDKVNLSDNTYTAGAGVAYGVGLKGSYSYNPSTGDSVTDFGIYTGAVIKGSIGRTSNGVFDIKSFAIGLGGAVGAKAEVGGKLGVFGDGLLGLSYDEKTGFHLGVTASGSLAGGIGEIKGKVRFGIGAEPSKALNIEDGALQAGLLNVLSQQQLHAISEEYGWHLDTGSFGDERAYYSLETDKKGAKLQHDKNSQAPLNLDSELQIATLTVPDEVSDFTGWVRGVLEEHLPDLDWSKLGIEGLTLTKKMAEFLVKPLVAKPITFLQFSTMNAADAQNDGIPAGTTYNSDGSVHTWGGGVTHSSSYYSGAMLDYYGEVTSSGVAHMSFANHFRAFADLIGLDSGGWGIQGTYGSGTRRPVARPPDLMTGAGTTTSSDDSHHDNPPGPGADLTQGTNKPIILDLDGNGIQITDLSQSTTYVDGGDGLEHRTAWAGAGDGVLFYDPDGTGEITEMRQYVFTEWDPTATSDMEALAAVFDTDGDGELSGAELADFRIMVTNADGTTTAYTLAELGTIPSNLTTARRIQLEFTG